MSELYHYGVKGMKWGVRNKTELKVAKRYAQAGKALGRAEYAKSKGDAAAKKYMDDAKVLDRQANAWNKQGQYIKAELARRASAALKEEGAKARAEYDAEVEMYMRSAERNKQKASKYATKKRVNLGKDKIDSILKASKKQSLADAKLIEERRREFEEHQRELEARAKEVWEN